MSLGSIEVVLDCSEDMLECAGCLLLDLVVVGLGHLVLATLVLHGL